MKQMAESNNYLILNEYEKVFLKLKATSQLILIGEFYGDPDVALISDDETYCAVGGEGVIIYYLRDPFEEFSTNHKSSNQWKIWGKYSWLVSRKISDLKSPTGRTGSASRTSTAIWILSTLYPIWRADRALWECQWEKRTEI